MDGHGRSRNIFIGVWLLGDPANLGRYLGVTLIIGGVVVLELAHRTQHRGEFVESAFVPYVAACILHRFCAPWMKIRNVRIYNVLLRI
jgi:hypothetical protein